MKKSKNLYFAEREEQAVIDYIITDSAEKRDSIYNTVLCEPFKKMIQSILRRYPIHIGSYEMGDVESFALSHLIEHMVKYRPFIVERKAYDAVEDKWNKLGDRCRFIYSDDAKETLDILNDEDDDYNYRIFNSKAYSYCQTIVRNYFKDHGKKTFNEKKINLSYDDYVDEIHNNSDYSYELENDHHVLDRLINSVVVKIEDQLNSGYCFKKNEIVVGEAIINVLKNWNVLFMEDSPEGKYNKRVTNKFAKNKILFFLKEQTGLSTKEIRLAMKPFKEIYFIERDMIFEE